MFAWLKPRFAALEGCTFTKETPMARTDFSTGLQSANEIEITVTDRTSGRSLCLPTCRLAKLLRHRWHRGGNANGLDVRGHPLDGTAPGAPVVVMEPCEGLQHLHHGAFWYRAADRRASERTLAGPLDGCFAAGPGWSGGGELRPHRALGGGSPSGGLSTGAL